MLPCRFQSAYFDHFIDFLPQDLPPVVIRFLYSAEKIYDELIEIFPLLRHDHLMEKGLPTVPFNTKPRIQFCQL